MEDQTIHLRHAPPPSATLDERVDQVLTNIDASPNPVQTAAIRGIVAGLITIESMRRELGDRGVEFEAFVAILATQAAQEIFGVLSGGSD